ncbi:MAG TPA: DUF1569 domain-containing protein [Gemmatimonadales bacterium]|nr:DUF1569 domain-containing protein [Gemmatimonadales bacterium]
MTDFAGIPDEVLGPLAGRAETDWYRAPPGKWCAAQIVHHLALTLELNARAFEERRARAPMRRRPRALREYLGYVLVLRLGWTPLGADAPAAVRPADRPDPRAVEQQLRAGVAHLRTLERDLLPARAADLFVRHPVLGDLTLPEWRRFHVWHCAHHTKQIRERLAS